MHRNIAGERRGSRAEMGSVSGPGDGVPLSSSRGHVHHYTLLCRSANWELRTRLPLQRSPGSHQNTRAHKHVGRRRVCGRGWGSRGGQSLRSAVSLPAPPLDRATKTGRSAGSANVGRVAPPPLVFLPNLELWPGRYYPGKCSAGCWLLNFGNGLVGALARSPGSVSENRTADSEGDWNLG